jgi:hypothetical protein
MMKEREQGDDLPLAVSYFRMSSGDEEPGTEGPRRVSKQELHDAFAGGWVIESSEPTRAEVQPDLKDLSFGEGGPRA